MILQIMRFAGGAFPSAWRRQTWYRCRQPVASRNCRFWAACRSPLPWHIFLQVFSAFCLKARASLSITLVCFPSVKRYFAAQLGMPNFAAFCSGGCGKDCWLHRAARRRRGESARGRTRCARLAEGTRAPQELIFCAEMLCQSCSCC